MPGTTLSLIIRTIFILIFYQKVPYISGQSGACNFLSRPSHCRKRNIFWSSVEHIIYDGTYQGYAYGHRQEEDVRAAVFQDLTKRSNDVHRHRGWYTRRRGKTRRQIVRCPRGPHSIHRRSHRDVPRERKPRTLQYQRLARPLSTSIREGKCETDENN